MKVEAESFKVLSVETRIKIIELLKKHSVDVSQEISTQTILVNEPRGRARLLKGEGRNMKIIANVPYASGSDMEFATIKGRDYAFAGSFASVKDGGGLHVIDITDPAAHYHDVHRRTPAQSTPSSPVEARGATDVRSPTNLRGACDTQSPGLIPWSDPLACRRAGTFRPCPFGQRPAQPSARTRAWTSAKSVAALRTHRNSSRARTC